MKRLKRLQQDIRLLEQAGATILKYGWIRLSNGNTERGFCSMGAIQKHASWGTTTERLLKFLHAQLTPKDCGTACHLATPVGWAQAGNFVQWNDYYATDKAQVLRVFDRGIRKLAEEIVVETARQAELRAVVVAADGDDDVAKSSVPRTSEAHLCSVPDGLGAGDLAEGDGHDGGGTSPGSVPAPVDAARDAPDPVLETVPC